MNTPILPVPERIQRQLRQFRLSGIANSLPLRLNEADENQMDHQAFLELLLEDEATNRADNRRIRIHKQAKFPYEKQLETFDFAFQPGVKKRTIMDLATGSYITKRENIIFVGQPGTGKTHLSIALGMQALRVGYTVLFTSAWEMITTLQQARADHSYPRKVLGYTKPDVLIIDELGYRSMGETTVEDMYEIVSRRYEKKPIIITSNRSIPTWDKIFHDKTLTGAIIDRLLHHCHVIPITGDSYRCKRKKT